MSRIPIVVFLLLLAGHTRSQSFCGFTAPADAPSPRMRIAELRGGGLQLIPTVVHVYYGEGQMPATPGQVAQMLEDCNRYLRAQNPDITEVVPAFAALVADLNVELRFATRDTEGQCMSGIRYHQYTPSIEPPDAYAYSMDTRSYLNIHIGASGQSFATYPQPIDTPYNPSDCIMLAGSFSDLAVTLAHEVGHYLGLQHTFGNTNNTGTCSDDMVADTPITAGSPLNCVLDRNECTPGVIENVQNHMDYSNCRIMFTQGQVDRMLDVLADPTLVRNSLVQPANLTATGVNDPPPCAITAGMHWRPDITCSGATVLFHAIAEGQVPDSVRWTFTGGSLTTAGGQAVVVAYSTSGSYGAQLTVYHNGSSSTDTRTVEVDMPDPNSNGLASVTALPFTSTFASGIDPVHMALEQSGDGGWTPFADAGFESSTSLYTPAGLAAQIDTSELFIGNMDLTSLQQPTIRFRIASTLQTFTAWSTLQVMFRDQCSNIFLGDVWAVQGVNEWASDYGPAFVPTADAHWSTVQVTFPEWRYASSAEFGIRLIRPAQSGLTAEAIYLDDLYIGELPLSTAIPEVSANTVLLVAPNPATHLLCTSAAAGAALDLLDAHGKLVRRWTSTGGEQQLPVQDLPRGLYLLRAAQGAGTRVVLE